MRIRNIVRQKEQWYHVFLEGQYWYDYIKSLGWQDKATFFTDTGIPKETFQSQADNFWKSLDGKKSYLKEVLKL